MELETPSLAEASPGQPITAQAWNELVQGILGVYEALNQLDTGSTLGVSVTRGGKNFPGARVVASNGVDSVEAVPPHGGTELYTLGGLSQGDWVLRVTGPGIAAKEQSVSMPSGDVFSVAVESDGEVVMPDLFGLSAKQVVAELGALSLDITTAYNVAGQELTRSSLVKVQAEAVLLMQIPAAGTLMDPEKDEARLVFSAEVAEKQLVKVPDVSGMTLAQAKSALMEVGLELGEIAYIDPAQA